MHHRKKTARIPGKARAAVAPLKASRVLAGFLRTGEALFALSLLAAVLVNSGCSGGGTQDAAPTVSVQVATARRTSIQLKVSADAVLYPLHQATIVPKISAPVTKYYVNLGTRVHGGQLMAELEDQDLVAALTECKGEYDQAQAAYETATRATLPEAVQKAELDVKGAKEDLDAQQLVYDSRKKLFAQGAIARRDLDTASVAYTQAKNQYEIAEKHLQALQSFGNTQDLKAAAGVLEAAKGKYLAAKAQLDYAQIRSPINGVVTERPLVPWEMASPGTPLITVMDLAEVVARAHISQQEAQFIQVGDPATIAVPGGAGEIAGKVTVVNPALDPSSTTVEVWVQAPNRNARLQPGTSVRVTIVAQTVKDAVVIPAAALLTAQDGSTSVMTVQGDKPQEVFVKAGIRDGSDLQILEGLNIGQQVVTAGAYELSQEDPDVLKKTKLQIVTPKDSEDAAGGPKLQE